MMKFPSSGPFALMANILQRPPVPSVPATSLPGPIPLGLPGGTAGMLPGNPAGMLMGKPQNPMAAMFGSMFSPGMFARPEAFQFLQSLFPQGLGNVSGGFGTRGPNRSGAAGMDRFSGPFGNGGGPLVPRMGWNRGMGQMR